MVVIIDPGHGMSNVKRGRYDSGATSHGVEEATVAMDWVNELRAILRAKGHTVVRTRVDAKDPCPVSRRDDIAVSYGGDLMISFHCNSGGGTGSEVFFRGEDDRKMAERLAATVSAGLGIRNRGAKTERESQHRTLAIMEFPKCWLIELGFIDSDTDRARMLNPALRKATCEALAAVITSPPH